MNRCIICGNSEFRIVYGNLLKKCLHCGFMTANMEIHTGVLQSVYTPRYFQGEEYFDYLRDKEVLRLNFTKRLKLIRNYLRGRLPMTHCLEIGCAYGFFGELLVKQADSDYRGIDVVQEAVDYGKNILNLNLINGDYLEQPAPGEPYSDVFMWDVIEHLPYPHTTLSKVHDELMPGGRIYITTGDISALLPRIQGKHWRMIHPPSHIHYFSAKSLHRLLEKTGFTVTGQHYLPTYRSGQQMYYSLFLLKKSGKFSRKLFNLIPSDWCIPVNTFDIVFLIAEKVNKIHQ